MTQDEILQKNIDIAKMLGAKQEQWYPTNKDTKNSGIYLCMSSKQFFPNGERWCGDSCLKFHSDANWQFEALEFVNTQGYCATSYPNTCEIENDDKSYYNISQGYTRKEAIFEALWQFSQYLKLKINRII